jgi:hypothetical protein
VGVGVGMGVGAGPYMVMDRFLLADWEALSVTLTVKPYAPSLVGVPVIVPVALLIRPYGQVPATMPQVYGGVPPEAWNWAW